MDPSEAKDVVGYEGLYTVTDDGQVYRISPWSLKAGKAPCRTPKTGPRCQKLAKNGYFQIILHNNGKKRQFQVHRLVCAAYIGEMPEGREVNHKNGIKTDNRVENLEYVTHSENMYHRYHVLGQKAVFGSGHHNAKITEEDVVEIRRMRGNGSSLRAICDRYGLSKGTACQITKRILWKHVL